MFGLLLVLAAAAPVTYDIDQITVAKTGDPRTITWCAVEGQTGSQFKIDAQALKWPPKSGAIPVFSARLPADATSWSFTPKKAGLYYAQARTCDTSKTPEICSAWNISGESMAPTSCVTDPARWVLDVEVSAPTPGGG